MITKLFNRLLELHRGYLLEINDRDEERHAALQPPQCQYELVQDRCRWPLVLWTGQAKAVRLERGLARSGEWSAAFVKFRRDKKNMPYAFCQYTNDRDASTAIFNGQWCWNHLLRSSLPTLSVNLLRGAFILRNYVGGVVGLDEARQVLQQHDAIGRLEDVSRDIADSHGVRPGILKTGKKQGSKKEKKPRHDDINYRGDYDFDGALGADSKVTRNPCQKTDTRRSNC
ncbi:hypothetical protein PG993_011293 [Apiospora rasikravindrae]|uniref:Transposase n=1 Tax=Apiospora rasikravindrae TaxID=990691 RepID=A0ABR1SDT0_9PEZI